MNRGYFLHPPAQSIPGLILPGYPSSSHTKNENDIALIFIQTRNTSV